MCTRKPKPKNNPILLYSFYEIYFVLIQLLTLDFWGTRPFIFPPRNILSNWKLPWGHLKAIRYCWQEFFSLSLCFTWDKSEPVLTAKSISVSYFSLTVDEKLSHFPKSKYSEYLDLLFFLSCLLDNGWFCSVFVNCENRNPY